MSKPDILIFVDWYRPGYKGGGPIRSMANMVDRLGDRARFHIVTSDTDYTAQAPYPGIVPDTWTELPTGERVWYASKAGTTTRRWKALLRERNWSVVYVNGMFSTWYSIVPLWYLASGRTRYVVAPRGMLLPGPMGQGALKKQVYLSLARAAGLYSRAQFHATSTEEVDSIRALLDRRAPVHLAGNLARSTAGSVRPERMKAAGEARLVNVVRIATEKNVHLIIEAMRGVKGKISLDLYGPVYHEEYWAQCRAAIATLPDNVRVDHHGPVPTEEVPRLFAGPYHALCMPNEGDNFGHTMLEALSEGLPLLISDRSPWRHLQAEQAGWDLPLDQGAEPFTRAMQALVDMDQRTFDPLVAGAYRMGRAYLDDPTPVNATAALLGI